MSWANVLTERQQRALSILYSSAKPSASATGIILADVRKLARLGLVSQFGANATDIESSEDIASYDEVSVTPAGFRAWADILEAKGRG